jgi:hypothetical protein
MARGNLELVTNPTIGSEDRGQVDDLAEQIEVIRDALTPLVGEVFRLQEAVYRAWTLLESLPKQP